MVKLTEARARNLVQPATGQRFVWCSEIKGFGVRVTPGARSYVVQVRYNGRSLRLTLGAVGVLPFAGPEHAPGARDLAIAAILAARRGQDPLVAIGHKRQPAGLTLAAVWAAYEAAGFPKKGVGTKRASSIATDKARWRKYVKEGLGAKAVSELDTGTVQRWLDKVPTLGQRRQCLLLVKALLTFAQSRGLATPHAIAIKASSTRTISNYLTPDELRRLDQACAALITGQPHRAPGWIIIRLLIATGCRSSEICSAERRHFDPANGTLWLPQDKRGDDGREVLLSPAAVERLASVPVTSSKYLFPAASRSGHVENLHPHFTEALAWARLRRVRVHDLRHSFASAAVTNGVSLYVVGELLGHKNPQTTQRYAHVDRGARRRALQQVTAAIEGGRGIEP